MRGQGDRDRDRGHQGRFRGRRGNGPRRFRDNDDRKPRDNGDRQGRNDDRQPHRRRQIHRDGRRNDRNKRLDDRDLDRELTDYWIKQKGGEGQVDGKEIARERMNAQMENYWKKAQEGEEKKADEKAK